MGVYYLCQFIFVGACVFFFIFGIRGIIHKLKHGMFKLAPKTTLEAFLTLYGLFIFLTILGGLYGVLHGNKHTSEGFLFGNLQQTIEKRQKEQEKERREMQKVQAFIDLAEDMSSFFVALEVMHDRNGQVSGDFLGYTLFLDQQKNYQEKYAQAVTTVQSYLDSQLVQECAAFYNEVDPLNFEKKTSPEEKMKIAQRYTKLEKQVQTMHSVI